jgi:hypothetical protein
MPFAAPTTIATFFSNVNVMSIMASSPKLYRVGGPCLRPFPSLTSPFDETARRVKGAALSEAIDPRPCYLTGCRPGLRHAG